MAREDLTDSAREEIAEAVRIVHEDKLAKYLRSSFRPAADPGGPPAPPEPPAPPTGPTPPPVKEKPEEPVPPRRKSVYWGDRIDDDPPPPPKEGDPK